MLASLVKSHLIIFYSFTKVTTATRSDPNTAPSEKANGVMFTEIFVKDRANVSLLLSLLEESDFYVRYSMLTNTRYYMLSVLFTRGIRSFPSYGGVTSPVTQ